MKPGIKTLVCSLVAAATALSAPAAEAAPARISVAAAQKAIDAKMAELAKLMARGEKGLVIVKAIYWPEASAGVDGMPKLLEGHAALGELMQASVPAGGITCTFTQAGPLVVSGNMATSFGSASCVRPGGDKPELSRSLHVWQKRGKQWKIVREQLGMGTYN